MEVIQEIKSELLRLGMSKYIEIKSCGEKTELIFKDPNGLIFYTPNLFKGFNYGSRVIRYKTQKLVESLKKASADKAQEKSKYGQFLFWELISNAYCPEYPIPSTDW